MKVLANDVGVMKYFRFIFVRTWYLRHFSVCKEVRLMSSWCLVHSPDPTLFTDQVVIPYVIPKPSIELMEKPEDNQTQLSVIRKIIGKEISHAYPPITKQPKYHLLL